ncbi:hypothetical protein DY218_30460 [Streptomyces triticagri]|uniref:YoaR-like putative peptidoglycan binding domain-containing protein n=1 Tax=Streptomyces triticagri TaxID=2293568 RepID=A0A372LW95_9ACTN|nr:hypothetical protein DY218_30460 [Streptomyces triticagri]
MRIAVAVSGAAVVAFGGLYLAGRLTQGDGIPEGTRVAGVDIGGLDSAAARERLTDEKGAAWASALKVRAGDRTASVSPAAAGLSVDIPATVDRAGVNSGNPFSVIGSLFSGTSEQQVDPVVRVDEDRARSALAATAKDVDRKSRDGAVTFRDGEAKAVQARTGQRLDVDGSVDALRDAYPVADDRPVTLPVDRSRPKVPQAEVDRAMAEFARPAMSAPVTLTIGAERITVSPGALARHLGMKAEQADGSGRTTDDRTSVRTAASDDGMRLVPVLDGKGLLADPALADPLGRAAGTPREAQLEVQGDKVVVAADGQPGRSVSAKDLQKAVLPLLTGKGEADRTGPVAGRTVQPKLTAESVQDLGIKEVMSSFTVNFPAAPYRTTNIGRAAELINGSLVMPGETWSFNETVGERTKENGFVDGTMILDGKYQEAAGGGVSSVATTVFNAVFFAGVKPVEYGAHSFYIERYPEGREATVAWGSLDQKFLNDSGHAMYIQATATDTSVTVTFLGTRKYDKIEAEKGPRTNITQPEKHEVKGDKCEPQTPYEGFDVSVDRIFENDGAEVRRETFKTHYTPRDEIICVDRKQD